MHLSASFIEARQRLVGIFAVALQQQDVIGVILMRRHSHRRRSAFVVQVNGRAAVKFNFAHARTLRLV